MNDTRSVWCPGKSHRKYLGSDKRLYGKMLILKETDGEIEN